MFNMGSTEELRIAISIKLSKAKAKIYIKTPARLYQIKQSERTCIKAETLNYANIYIVRRRICENE
jgi:hypothetical protein